VEGYKDAPHYFHRAALQELAHSEPFVRRIIGGAPIPLLAAVPVEYREWSEACEVEELQMFSVGIMPLVDGAWEQGNCGLKLTQYLAAGVPVAATPVGANARVVQPGITGLMVRVIPAAVGFGALEFDDIIE
jgi:glycosyltransferase involved in cell wall biosynthesis